ncbi:MAG: DEAD/DEAH box helicase, partial [Propionibacteriaceae bacterium]|nr:DEAD/DEAH box helicase [Propionibacteriaceae bacterium]
MDIDPLGRFSPATATWFREAFGAPTPAQAEAWRAIAGGGHTLVIAPTGSGKTLAAFLWSVDQLLTADGEPGSAARLGPARCRVLYVSPLKALATDIERNLRAPLAGVRAAAVAAGGEPPAVSVAVRSGDTPADERRRFARQGADILITTPESLYLLLTSAARERLAGVEWVILDEIHSLAGAKRGAHLAVSLERLDARLARPAQRIGLSATVEPPAAVARYLAGGRPVEIVAPPTRKDWELTVVVPVPDLGDLASAPAAAPAAAPSVRPRQVVRAGSSPGAPSWLSAPASSRPPGPAPAPARTPAPRASIWPHVTERLADLIAEHRSTIVFVNSRQVAERLASRLNELWETRGQAADALADGEMALQDHSADGPPDGSASPSEPPGPQPYEPLGSQPDSPGVRPLKPPGSPPYESPGPRHDEPLDSQPHETPGVQSLKPPGSP